MLWVTHCDHNSSPDLSDNPRQSGMSWARWSVSAEFKPEDLDEPVQWWSTGKERAGGRRHGAGHQELPEHLWELVGGLVHRLVINGAPEIVVVPGGGGGGRGRQQQWWGSVETQSVGQFQVLCILTWSTLSIWESHTVFSPCRSFDGEKGKREREKEGGKGKEKVGRIMYQVKGSLRLRLMKNWTPIEMHDWSVVHNTIFIIALYMQTELIFLLKTLHKYF